MNYYEDENTENFVKKYLDIIILAMINNKILHGYQIIADIHSTFGVLLSPGTLYPLLYRFEKEKLVKVVEEKRRKLYQITPIGIEKMERTIESYQKNMDNIILFINNQK